MKRPGINIIICCHNSAKLLPATLRCLAGQVTDPRLKWEILVIDNASTDGTATVCEEVWSSMNSSTELRIVHEPRLGLIFAREKGMAEAQYEFLSFVDDDNSLAPDWVQTAWTVMSIQERVGVCGGFSEPHFEGPPPPWFASQANLYAIGPQTDMQGDVTGKMLIWGAGMTVRYTALKSLKEQYGFESILVGRRGTHLSSGEDSELCLALRLAGWRIWYEPRLRLTHFLPARRLNWDYLLRFVFGSAFATPALDGFYNVMKPPRSGFLSLIRRLREAWLWQLAAAAAELMRVYFTPRLQSQAEACNRDLQIAYKKGRLHGLVSARGWYTSRIRELRTFKSRVAAANGSVEFF